MFRAAYRRNDSEPLPARRTVPAGESGRRAWRGGGARLGPYRRAAGTGRARVQAGCRRRLVDRLAGRRLLRGRAARDAGGLRPFADQEARVRPPRLSPSRAAASSAASGSARGSRRRSAGCRSRICRSDSPASPPRSATDTRSGSARGSLVDAIRASYALPGVFEPVKIDGRWLFDGAIVNPVPVSVARALGAERVIALNISSDSVGRGTAIQDPFGRLEPPAATEDRASDSSGVIARWWRGARSGPAPAPTPMLRRPGS